MFTIEGLIEYAKNYKSEIPLFPFNRSKKKVFAECCIFGSGLLQKCWMDNRNSQNDLQNFD